eukprot:4239814-Amphidinium_carterae.1
MSNCRRRLTQGLLRHSCYSFYFEQPSNTAGYDTLQHQALSGAVHARVHIQFRHNTKSQNELNQDMKHIQVTL